MNERSQGGLAWRLARTLTAIVLLLQLVWSEVALLQGFAFSGIPAPRALIALLLLGLFAAGLWALRGRSRFPRAARWALVGSLLLFTVRFHSARILNNWYAEHWFPEHVPTPSEARAAAFLRLVASAQEQYRMTTGIYSSDLRHLPGVPDSGVVRVDLTGRGDRGWSGRAIAGDATCSMWVRDLALREIPSQAEGAPKCRAEETRVVASHVATVIDSTATEAPFTSVEVGGEWLQHRAGAARTGYASVSSDSSGFQWIAHVGGELRASASVAGGQVFAGAHGNGEFVAYHLSSGRRGFRLRAPNWIHHEASLTSTLAIVGFGNNEHAQSHPLVGSAPSGVVAYDRRTGVQRWIQFLPGSVMTEPVIADSLVVALSTGAGATAFRLSDGRAVWHTDLPGLAVMGNAALVDSLMLVGLELRTICALNVRSGSLVYCRDIPGDAYDVGLASLAATATTGVAIYGRGVDTRRALSEGRYWRVFRRAFGAPVSELAEQAAFGFDVRTGRELWRTPLGIGDREIAGHVAGTPTLTDSVAYVTSPRNGHVVAVALSTGRVLWSAPTNPARGSVTVVDQSVLSATRDGGFVVLDAVDGRVRCRQRLPATSDRAGPTVAGSTGILTLKNGMIMARPLAAWRSCRA